MARAHMMHATCHRRTNQIMRFQQILWACIATQQIWSQMINISYSLIPGPRLLCFNLWILASVHRVTNPSTCLKKAHTMEFIIQEDHVVFLTSTRILVALAHCSEALNLEDLSREHSAALSSLILGFQWCPLLGTIWMKYMSFKYAIGRTRWHQALLGQI